LGNDFRLNRPIRPTLPAVCYGGLHEMPAKKTSRGADLDRLTPGGGPKKKRGGGGGGGGDTGGGRPLARCPKLDSPYTRRLGGPLFF